jgi:hypothetical protein
MLPTQNISIPFDLRETHGNCKKECAYCDVHAVGQKVNRGRTLCSNRLAHNNRRNCGFLSGPFRHNNKAALSMGSIPRLHSQGSSEGSKSTELESQDEWQVMP